MIEQFYAVGFKGGSDMEMESRVQELLAQGGYTWVSMLLGIDEEEIESIGEHMEANAF